MREAPITLTTKTSPTLRPFAVLSLLASFLLFFVQPLIAKMALPQLGGSPAVWTSAMLAYQALLLVGYAYAHWLLGRARRWQIAVHLALMVAAMFWLPLSFNAADAPQGDVLAFWVPWRVIVAVGPLFVLLAAMAPLLQGWLRDSSGVEPYALYRFSNIGSFLGLLAFPLAVEPQATLTVQKMLWSAGFVIFAVALAALMLATLRRPAMPQSIEQTKAPHSWPDWRTALKWIALAAIPSGLILSTTTHVTTDIIAMPLLWVLPLALYLLSFVIAFTDIAPFADRIAKYAGPLIAILGLIALSTDAFEVYITGPASMALLFVVGIALHRRLYLSRPDASGLTSFYLMLALGGALGGLLVAVIAPLVFDWTYEFPLLLLAAIAFAQVNKIAARPTAFSIAIIGLAIALTAANALNWTHFDPIWYAPLFALAVIVVRQNRIVTTAIALCGFLCISGIDSLYLSANGLRQRSYFGIYTIGENEAGTVRRLTHGTTAHGAQSLIPGKRTEPLSYFGHQSGVGRVLDAVPGAYGANARIGIVGIGAGTLACYARSGQHWTFYEIDPLVVDIAVRQRWFSYMIDCAPEASVRLGDARLTLATQGAQSLDVLVIDAFTSDSVPTHLLTKQAFDIYDRILARNGALMIHISNRYFDLEPVLAKEAHDRRWSAAIRQYVPDATRIKNGETASVWVLLTRSPEQTNVLTGRKADWRSLNQNAGFTRWGDDFGSVLPLIKWR